MIQLQLAGKKLLTIESLFHLMWAKITRAAVECLCITEVNVRNYLGRPSEIRITGAEMDSRLRKVCAPLHSQELLLGSGYFSRDLTLAFKWGHVTEF